MNILEEVLADKGYHDNHAETKVLHLVLIHPELLDTCTLDAEDFQLWSRQWSAIKDKHKRDEPFCMFKGDYNQKFGMHNFMLNNTYVQQKDFGLFVSQVRDSKIKERLRCAESLEEVEELLTHRIKSISIDDFDKQLSNHYDSYMEKRERRAAGFVGVKTGHKWIDQRVVFDKERLVTIAGRPGQGKSSLALGLAIGMAHHSSRVLFLSLEMTQQQMINRAISQVTDTPLSDISMARIEDISPLYEKYQAYVEKRLDIIHPKGASLSEIKKITAGYDVIVVDQLSRVGQSLLKGETKASLYGRITMALKSLAIDQSQLVVLCCQINRQGNDKPQLIHLKDSGSIEEESDIVLLIHSADDMTEDVTVECAKNRDGEEGTSWVYKFKRKFTKFVPKIN